MRTNGKKDGGERRECRRDRFDGPGLRRGVYTSATDACFGHKPPPFPAPTNSTEQEQRQQLWPDSSTKYVHRCDGRRAEPKSPQLLTSNHGRSRFYRRSSATRSRTQFSLSNRAPPSPPATQSKRAIRSAQTSTLESSTERVSAVGDVRATKHRKCSNPVRDVLTPSIVALPMMTALLVGVPGPFTPPCSSHVPGYIRDAEKFQQKGIKVSGGSTRGVSLNHPSSNRQSMKAHTCSRERQFILSL